MKIETRKKESFVVIGKEGATTDGAGFIQKLWDEANSHFGEIAHLAKKGKMGTSAEYGAQCLTFPVPSSPGKAFRKDFTLQGWSVIRMQRLPMAGQNG